MALRAYARHRSTSVQAVLRAIKSGRLVKCLVFDAAGKAKIGDPAVADAEWTANTDHSRAPGYVKERAAQQQPSTAPVAVTPAAPPKAPATTQAATQPRLKDEVPASDRQKQGDALAPLDPDSRWNLNDASAEEKKWKALKAEADYKKTIGELVSAKDVQDRIANDYTIVRTRLLGVPGKVRTRAPHLTLSDVALIEAEIREALEQLATEPIAPASTGTAA